MTTTRDECGCYVEVTRHGVQPQRIRRRIVRCGRHCEGNVVRLEEQVERLRRPVAPLLQVDQHGQVQVVECSKCESYRRALRRLRDEFARGTMTQRIAEEALAELEEPHVCSTYRYLYPDSQRLDKACVKCGKVMDAGLRVSDFKVTP